MAQHEARVKLTVGWALEANQMEVAVTRDLLKWKPWKSGQSEHEANREGHEVLDVVENISKKGQWRDLT